jgi:hypothetical protein
MSTIIVKYKRRGCAGRVDVVRGREMHVEFYVGPYCKTSTLKSKEEELQDNYKMDFRWMHYEGCS